MSHRAAHERWATIRNGLATLLGVTLVALGVVGPRPDVPARVAPLGSEWTPLLPAIRAVPPAQRAPYTLIRGDSLDLATATQRDLELIDGIGPGRARQLLAARRAGALDSLVDVGRLPGFGPVLLGKLGAALGMSEAGSERGDE